MVAVQSTLTISINSPSSSSRFLGLLTPEVSRMTVSGEKFSSIP